MTPPASLTSGRLLARNVLLNAAGGALPVLAMLVTIPVLVRGLGDARFGIVALAWTTVGYFSIFDLGLGRALTQAVASRLGDGRASEVPTVVWTGLALLAPVALAGMIALWAIAPWLATTALQVPAPLQSEARTAFRVLALAIPLTVLAAALRGVLEAKQRFGIVNALRAPYGLLTFLGPIAALPFTRSVVPAVAMLTLGRAMLAVGYLVACWRVVPGLHHARAERRLARPLLSVGGWMTVSNVVSPLMNTADQFVVGAAIAVSAVTYYATPYELATKLWMFTAAVLPVFFPAFATTAATDRARTAALLDRCLRLVFGGLWLPAFVLVLLARELLGAWVGPAFGADSARVLQVLAVAVFVNTIGQGALTLVHSLGRPELSARLHLAELPAYALLLWLLLPRFGLVGVALAWAIRAVADSVLLLWVSRSLLPEARHAIARIARWLAVTIPVFAAAALVPSSGARMVIGAVATLAWGAIAWWGILTPDERAAPLRALRPVATGD